MNMKIIRLDRGSVFYRCMLSDKDPRFPKYPRLPVVSCTGWSKAERPNERRHPPEGA
jgi:hypothetical protein